jgi:hypothetical protein
VTDDLSGVLDKASYQNDARASNGTLTFDAASKQLVWSGTLGPAQHATITYSAMGQKLTYTITVTNAGPNPASDVRVIDGSRRPLKVISVHPGQGGCNTGRPIRCRLGTLASHAHATIRVQAIAQVVGAQLNTALVMSGSWDPAVRNNLALGKTTITPVPTAPPSGGFG